MWKGLLNLLLRSKIKGSVLQARKPELVELFADAIAKQPWAKSSHKNLPMYIPPHLDPKTYMKNLRTDPQKAMVRYDFGSPTLKIPPRVAEGDFIPHVYRGSTMKPVKSLQSRTGKEQGIDAGGFHSSDLMEARKYAIRDSKSYQDEAGRAWLMGLNPDNPGVIRKLKVNRPWEKMKKYWTKNIPGAFESPSHFAIPQRMADEAPIALLQTMIARARNPIFKNKTYKDQRQLLKVLMKILRSKNKRGKRDWTLFNRGGLASFVL